MTMYVGAIKDKVFVGEHAHMSRGFLAVYRRDGENVWTPCKNWIADGHGSGHYANIWRDTAEQSKADAKAWLRKRARK